MSGCEGHKETIGFGRSHLSDTAWSFMNEVCWTTTL